NQAAAEARCEAGRKTESSSHSGQRARHLPRKLSSESELSIALLYESRLPRPAAPAGAHGDQPVGRAEGGVGQRAGSSNSAGDRTITSPSHAAGSSSSSL